MKLQLSLIGGNSVPVAFPHFAADERNEHWNYCEHDEILPRLVPAKDIQLADGSTARVATVYDLTMANYGIDRASAAATSLPATTMTFPLPRHGRKKSLAYPATALSR